MTVRQIRIGMALGAAVSLAGLTDPIPDGSIPLGLLIMIAAIIIGGADGTLPRM